MYRMTASVPHAIREVLSSNTLYLQALKSGIANYTALAQRMKADVETIIGAQVNVGTIVVAIKRFSDILEKVFEKETGYNLFQTSKQLRLFTEDIDEIRNIISTASKKFDCKMKEGLSKITINFPSANPYNNEQTPYNNLLPFVSEVLYNNQIPLYNAFFAPNETVLILKNKDAARAYELLRAKITK